MTLTGFAAMMVSFGLMAVFTVVHAREEQDRSTSSPHSEDSHQPRFEHDQSGITSYSTASPRSMRRTALKASSSRSCNIRHREFSLLVKLRATGWLKSSSPQTPLCCRASRCR